MNAALPALCLIAVYFGYSVLTICHTAWGGELSEDYHERSRIAGSRQVADRIRSETTAEQHMEVLGVDERG